MNLMDKLQITEDKKSNAIISYFITIESIIAIILNKSKKTTFA